MEKDNVKLEIQIGCTEWISEEIDAEAAFKN
jgi:hypothetical protein